MGKLYIYNHKKYKKQYTWDHTEQQHRETIHTK